MKVPILQGHYIKSINVNESNIDIDFAPRKKVALLFVCLNDRYWPYLTQVLNDCRKNFLPQHKVDYFVWTDFNEENKQKLLKSFEDVHLAFVTAPLEKKQAAMNQLLEVFTSIVRLYEHFYGNKIQQALEEIAKQGIFFKREGPKFWVESQKALTDLDIALFYNIGRMVLELAMADLEEALKGVTIVETDPVGWPAPTLLRYHLFLNKEEELKEYDYVYYLDADMKVVSKVSDEILGDGLMAAPHPGYYLAPNLIPPLEPNPDSTAYIPRLGQYVQEGDKKRFLPFYAAGGFQGGNSKEFIEAMKVLKKNIDLDFDRNNYTAIWNDETHWNKFLWDYQKSGGKIVFLDPSYVYPDSMIDAYYVPKVWGQNYEPKIITLTKPFTLSAQAASELAKMTQ